ncbi:MAG: hypothetical protein LBQ88_22660 [Treponema sp.]|jgi:hypothetical protein|nr:hypothetical protein [Treponema sp.]
MKGVLYVSGFSFMAVILSCTSLGSVNNQQGGYGDSGAAAAPAEQNRQTGGSRGVNAPAGQTPGQTGNNYTGDGGKDTTLAILRTAVQGGALGDDEWLVELIPNVLMSSFKNFSAITIVDRQNDETVREEQQRAMSGNISDESAEEVAVGNEIAAQYQLTSTIRKIGNTNFNLTMTITDVRRNEVTVFYNNEGRNQAFELRDASAIKQAALNLLEGMGVRLTEAGRTNLLGTSSDANIYMARGIAAQAQGRTIEAQSFFNNAISFDSSLLEAAERLRTVNQEVVSSVGGEIRNDVKNYEMWRDYLASFDEFYENHPPFQLLYTQAVNTNNIDYQGQTYEIAIAVGIRRTALIAAMQRTMDTIRSDLDKTGRKKVWGFTGWPSSSSIFSKAVDNYPPRIFKIKAVVLDADRPNVRPLAEQDFELSGKLVLYNGRIYADEEKDLNLVFPRIHYETSNDIPSNLLVKIQEIDGMDGDKANADGYITLTSVPSLPRPQGPTYPRNLVSQMQRESLRSQQARDDQRRREGEAAEKAERERQKRLERSDPWYEFRLGFNFEGGAYFGGGAGFGSLGMFIGVDTWYLGLEVPLLFGHPSPAQAIRFGETDSATMVGFGGMFGYSFVGRHLILTGSGGVNFLFSSPDDSDSGSSGSTEDVSRATASIFLKAQLDWIWNVFGLRFGYILEFQDPSINEDFFYKTKSMSGGPLNALDKFSIGLIMIF